jgi:hypothetical protein
MPAVFEGVQGYERPANAFAAIKAFPQNTESAQYGECQSLPFPLFPALI